MREVLPWCKILLILRILQEDMINAYLTESDEYAELLRYCNITFECLPYVLNIDMNDLVKGKSTKKLCASSIVSVGYAGDMEDDLADELLDDIDFRFNKVHCHKIELLLPQLDKLMERKCKRMDCKRLNNG
jgi:hypothetical protein